MVHVHSKVGVRIKIHAKLLLSSIYQLFNINIENPVLSIAQDTHIHPHI